MKQIQPASPRQYARLLSVAGQRGSRVVTNDYMCTLIDSSDEWIQQRTGITQRRWVDDGESALSLAVEAGRKAIARAGLSPEEIDAILVATVSHMQQFPSLAVSVADELGLSDPAAFDISAGCAGFCYLISTAESMVRAGTAKHVLIIGVETLSRMTNFKDRTTAFLFADGAGAAVVGPSEEPAIGPPAWGSDAAQASTISSDPWTMPGSQSLIHMDGRKVFRWATTTIAQKTLEALVAAGLEPEDLDVFIPHQANNRITDSMLRHLKLPESVVVSRDIKLMGNSSAASVPIAMSALLESGQASSGQIALTVAFGAGLVYAAQVLVLP